MLIGCGAFVLGLELPVLVHTRTTQDARVGQISDCSGDSFKVLLARDVADKSCCLIIIYTLSQPLNALQQLDACLVCGCLISHYAFQRRHVVSVLII